MATKISPPDLQGILIPAAQFSVDNLVAKDDGTTPSAYTTAGARTGVPKATAPSAMVLQGSGKQDEDGSIEIVCARAGLPGLERGGFVWRDEATWASGSARTADSASEYYGWDAPSLVTGWHGLDFVTTGRAVLLWPDLVRLDNATLFAVYGFSTITEQFLFASYDPSTGAWTKTAAQIDSQDWNSTAVTILQLPRASGDANGDLLLYFDSRSGDQVSVARSTDLGATWAIAGRHILGTAAGGAIVNLRARYSGGQVLLFAQWTSSGAETLDQYVSTGGRGVDFVQVQGDTEAVDSEEMELPNIIPIPGGGFVVATHDPDASAPRVNYRRLGSGSTKLTDAAIETASHAAAKPASSPGLTLFRDEDGALNAYSFNDGGLQDLAFVRSTDEGATWTTIAELISLGRWDTGGAGTPEVYPHTFAAEMIGGRIFMLTRWKDNATSSGAFDAHSIAVIEIGGYSRHTAPAHQLVSDFADGEYAAFADDPASKNTGLPGDLYLPFDNPVFIGDQWAEITSGGTNTITSSGVLETVTTADTDYFTHEPDTSAFGPGTAAKMLWAEVHHRITAGNPGHTTQQVALALRFTNGNASNNSTFDYHISIRMQTGGYRIYDENASPTNVATVAYSGFTANASNFVVIRVFLDDSGRVFTTHAADAGHYRQFVAGATVTGLTDAGASTTLSRIRWGMVAASSLTVEWQLLGWCAWCYRANGAAATTAAQGFTNPDHLHARSFPAAPSLVSGGARIRAVDGPAFVGDTWDIVARYDYPPAFWFSDKDPSPQRLPRTTGDNVAVDLVIEQDATSSKSQLLSECVGAFVRGANFPGFTLSRWSSGAWHTIATATGKIDSLAWKRNGRYIIVDTGTSGTASQFIRWGDLAGGTFAISSTVHRSIVACTSGAWTDGTTARPVLELDPDEMTGSEATNGTAGEVWFPEFGVVIDDYTATDQIFRVQIQASHTAEDYYTGKFIIGSVHPFGWPHDRGWAMREEHDVDLTTRPGGLRTAVKRSPPRRTLQVAWVETSVDEMQILKGIDAANLPDYVAVGTNPSAARHSTISDVLGIIRQQSGPRDPIVFIRRIKEGAGSEEYVGSHLWIHGRIETTDPQVDNVLGREGADPLNKLNTILIVEEQ